MQDLQKTTLVTTCQSDGHATNITLPRCLNGRLFDHWVTIYHLGEQISSGHYTTKISYTEAAYICDDLNVTSVDILQNNKS